MATFGSKFKPNFCDGHHWLAISQKEEEEVNQALEFGGSQKLNML
jgi:hypothetical protein